VDERRDRMKKKPYLSKSNEENERKIFRLLTLPWEALTDDEREKYVEPSAVGVGYAYANVFDGFVEEEVPPNVAGYYHSIVTKALEMGIINDIEAELWRTQREMADPRLAWFAKGCKEARRGGREKARMTPKKKKRAKKKARKKAIKKAEKEAKRTGHCCWGGCGNFSLKNDIYCRTHRNIAVEG